MLQRLLSMVSRNHSKDLGNILQNIKSLPKKAKLLVLYAYLPVSVLPTGAQLPIAHVVGKTEPVAATLPVTGGEPEAKVVATIVAEKFPSPVQRPFSGGMLTTRYSSWHPGIDLAIASGTPMKPIMKGKVVEAAKSYFGYGNMVVIDHGNGMKTLYAHLSKISVKQGDVVEPDTVIGLVGSTGRSTGPHLHLEVHTDTGTMNPLDILPEDAPTAVADKALTGTGGPEINK